MTERFDDMDTLLREVASDWRERCPDPPSLESFLEPLYASIGGRFGRDRPRSSATAVLAVACAVGIVAGVIALLAVFGHTGRGHAPMGTPTPTTRVTRPSPTQHTVTTAPTQLPKRWVRLTTAQRRAISHARHGYLGRHCLGAIGTEPVAAATHIAGRPVLVATADCSSSASGSPIDIGVYIGLGGARLRQLYLLDTGRPFYRGRAEITAVDVSVHGASAVVHYSGFTGGEPMCCPSRSYHRVFHLALQGATQGPLIRDHNRRILGPN